jgi:hypothetical protein
MFIPILAQPLYLTFAINSLLLTRIQKPVGAGYASPRVDSFV